MAELPTPVPGRATIGRWNVDEYFDYLRWPTIVGPALTLLLTLVQQTTTVVVVAEMLAIIWTGWTVVQHRGGRAESLASGAIVGLAAGLAYSLGLFIVQPSALTLISSVWQTLMTGIVGSLLATSVVLLLSFRHSKN